MKMKPNVSPNEKYHRLGHEQPVHTDPETGIMFFTFQNYTDMVSPCGHRLATRICDFQSACDKRGGLKKWISDVRAKDATKVINIRECAYEMLLEAKQIENIWGSIPQ